MTELFHEPEFWVLVAFVVFIAAIAKKGYVAVTGLLDARAAKIKEELGSTYFDSSLLSTPAAVDRTLLIANQHTLYSLSSR